MSVTGMEATHRRFLLSRSVDMTGISGTGIVAEGVEFSDGTVVMRWLPVVGPAAARGVVPTTAVHDNVTSVVSLHGHGGATKIEWID